jgi:chemotaxis protein methyltransferase CheR
MKSRPTEAPETIQKVVKKVSSVVTDLAGIQLGPTQFSMVESRLRSRMLKLSIQTFEDYLGHLNAHYETETQALLSLLTTHHSYFFREFAHFSFLLETGLEKLVRQVRSRGDKKIRIWSAASSRGQEAFSLALFLDFHLSTIAPDLDFEIWGTDVDAQSIRYAQNGVYPYEDLKQVPPIYARNCWIRGTTNFKNFAKIRNSLREKCHFSTLNVLKADSFLQGKMFDVIFCRNVFIYFNAEQIKTSVEGFLEHLHPDGFLFLGVSENLNGLGLDIETVAASIYTRKAARTPAAASILMPPRKSDRSSGPSDPRPRKVLIVDDSASVRRLLVEIIKKDPLLEVVAQAEKPSEVEALIQRHRPDLITLDIHMPEMDGVTLLQKIFPLYQIPTVMITSVRREDGPEVLRALEIGAVDYIQKPALGDLASVSTEICERLRIASEANVGLKASSRKVLSRGAHHENNLVLIG